VPLFGTLTFLLTHDSALRRRDTIPVPNVPAIPETLVDQTSVSVVTLNVTDYTEFPKADPASLKAFDDLHYGFAERSLEINFLLTIKLFQ
jgi:hypothetical protein